jgi:hypothetical protein
MGQINRYNAATAPLTVPLPALSSVNEFARTMVQKDILDATSHAVTFNRVGSDQFDDATTSFALSTPGESRTLQVVRVGGVKRWKITEAMHDTGGGSGNISSVIVTTGSETRPSSAVVIWVGGTTEPDNIGADDVWLQEGPGALEAMMGAVGIGFAPGDYYRLNMQDPAFATSVMIENQCTANIFLSARSATLTQLAVQVTGAGSTGAVIRFGVYEYDGAVATLVADFGTAAATSTGVISKTGSAPMLAGKRYVAVAVAQGGATTRPTVSNVDPGVLRGTSVGFSSASTLYAIGIGGRIADDASGALVSSSSIVASGDGIPCMVGRCAT